MRDIRIKRVYEPAAASDGFRVLVDRLWPRGLKKEAADIDLWAKDIAPSTELRKWFHAHREAWDEFRARYLAELAHADAALRDVITQCGARPMTLLYAAKPSEHTHATVLRERLLGL